MLPDCFGDGLAACGRSGELRAGGCLLKAAAGRAGLLLFSSVVETLFSESSRSSASSNGLLWKTALPFDAGAPRAAALGLGAPPLAPASPPLAPA